MRNWEVTVTSLHSILSCGRTIPMDSRDHRSLRVLPTSQPGTLRLTLILQTDASDYGVGGYLFSVTNGKVPVIRFFSKALIGAQLNWSTREGVQRYILRGQDIRGPTGQSAFHSEDRPHEPYLRQTNCDGNLISVASVGIIPQRSCRLYNGAIYDTCLTYVWEHMHL